MCFSLSLFGNSTCCNVSSETKEGVTAGCLKGGVIAFDSSSMLLLLLQPPSSSSRDISSYIFFPDLNGYVAPIDSIGDPASGDGLVTGRSLLGTAKISRW